MHEHDQNIVSQQFLEVRNSCTLECMIHRRGGEPCAQAGMLQNMTSRDDVKMMQEALPRSEQFASAKEFWVPKFLGRSGNKTELEHASVTRNDVTRNSSEAGSTCALRIIPFWTLGSSRNKSKS